jgi:hypothetical protein
MMFRSIAVGAAVLFALSINFASAAQNISVANHKPPPGVTAGGTVVKDSGGTSHGSTSVAVDTDMAVKANAHSNGPQGCTTLAHDSVRGTTGKTASISDQRAAGSLSGDGPHEKTASLPCSKGNRKGLAAGIGGMVLKYAH